MNGNCWVDIRLGGWQMTVWDIESVGRADRDKKRSIMDPSHGGAHNGGWIMTCLPWEGRGRRAARRSL